MHEQKKCLILIVPFFASLATFCILGVCATPQKTSFAENRELMQVPVFKASDDGRMKMDPATYVVEQFPYRETLLKVYSFLDLIQNKKYVRDTYVAHREWLMIRSYRIADDRMEELAGAISGTVSGSPDNVEFYYAILPIKSACFSELERSYIDDSTSNENKERLKKELGGLDSVKVIDVSGYFTGAFSLEEREEMYFRTDFHWNAWGAYNASDYIQRVMCSNGTIGAGDLFSKTDFSFDVIDDKLYQGDLNRRFSNLFSMKERIPVISPRLADGFRYFTSVGDESPAKRSDIVGNGLEEGIVSYDDVYTHNIGYYRILNERAPCDKSILILKDSLENPMGDYFASIFKEVQIIDPRAYSEPCDFSGLIDKKSVDIVLFAFHQNNCSQELINFLNSKSQPGTDLAA